MKRSRTTDHAWNCHVKKSRVNYDSNPFENPETQGLANHLLSLPFTEVMQLSKSDSKCREIIVTDIFWKRKTQRDWNSKNQYPCQTIVVLDIVRKTKIVRKTESWFEEYISYGRHPKLINQFLEAAEKGNLRVLRELLDVGVNPNCRTNMNMITALMKASNNRHSDVVKMLLDAGANPNLMHQNGQTALMYASYKGHVDIVKMLLEAGANPNLTDKNRRTALMMASSENKALVASILIDFGVNINFKDVYSDDALTTASVFNNKETVDVLAKAGATYFDIEGLPEFLCRIILLSLTFPEIKRLRLVNHNFNNIVDDFFWKKKIEVDFKSISEDPFRNYKYGFEKFRKSRNWFEEYLSYGQQYEQKLIDAVGRGSFTQVKRLLNIGVNPNTRGKALLIASEKGYERIVKILLQAGAKITCWEIKTAARMGHENVVKLMASAIKDTKLLEPALIEACSIGRTKIVKMLIDTGMNLNYQNQIYGGGDSPLILSTRNGRLNIVKMLLSAGADPNFTNKEGFTAIMAASLMAGHVNLITTLIGARASLNLTNQKEFTALMIACEQGNINVARILASYDAKFIQPDRFNLQNRTVADLKEIMTSQEESLAKYTSRARGKSAPLKCDRVDAILKYRGDIYNKTKIIARKHTTGVPRARIVIRDTSGKRIQ